MRRLPSGENATEGSSATGTCVQNPSSGSTASKVPTRRTPWRSAPTASVRTSPSSHPISAATGSAKTISIGSSVGTGVGGAAKPSSISGAAGALPTSTSGHSPLVSVDVLAQPGVESGEQLVRDPAGCSPLGQGVRRPAEQHREGVAGDRGERLGHARADVGQALLVPAPHVVDAIGQRRAARRRAEPGLAPASS